MRPWTTGAGGELTCGDGVGSTTSSNQIGAQNTNIDGERENASPPANKIANQVDLLLTFGLCPKADTGKKEGPVDRRARVWVRRCQSSIMLEH